MDIAEQLSTMVADTKAAKDAERGSNATRSTSRTSPPPGHDAKVAHGKRYLDKLDKQHRGPTHVPEKQWTQFDLAVCPYKERCTDGRPAFVVPYFGKPMVLCFEAKCDRTWPETWPSICPTLNDAAPDHGGTEGRQRGWHFRRAEQAVATLLAMGLDLDADLELFATSELAKSPAFLDRRPDGRILFEVKPPSDYQAGSGWTVDGKKVFRLLGERRLLLPIGDLVRTLRAENGEDLGGHILGADGDWLSTDKGTCKDAIRDEYGRELADSKWLEAVQDPWKLVQLPFAPEFLPGKQWNKDAPQYAYQPIPGDWSAWGLVLDHCGQDLDKWLAKDAWAVKHGILKGSLYLKHWIANLLRRPLLPLPYLFFHGPSQSGKGHFFRSVGRLVTKGVCKADRALAAVDNFNGELRGCILAVVNETDFSADKAAYARLKDWVDGDQIWIREMQRGLYPVRNTLHFGQTANDAPACPIFDGDDSRITAVFVPMPIEPIPRDKFDAVLIDQAPAFMAEIMAVDLIEPECRLAIPAILTDSKINITAKNDPVGTFLRLHTKAAPGATLAKQDLLERYNAWAATIGGKALSPPSFGKHFARTHQRFNRGDKMTILVDGEPKRVDCYTDLELAS